MKSPIELNSLLSRFFCYMTWFIVSPDLTQHWTTYKRGLYVKFYYFFETISQRFKNYKLSFPKEIQGKFFEEEAAWIEILREFQKSQCFFALTKQFARIHTSSLINIEKILNRPITKFYNSDDVNVIAAELRLTKTRPISFYKKHNLS